MSVTVTPYVNLNGTARAALLEAHADAAEAVRTAADALDKTRPHGRDYQTAPEGRYTLAVAEWEARMAALSSILADLEALAETLAEV